MQMDNLCTSIADAAANHHTHLSTNNKIYIYMQAHIHNFKSYMPMQRVMGREFIILTNSFSNALSAEVKNRKCLMRVRDDVSVVYYLPFALANVCLHDGFLSFSRGGVF
jgi:hypothetical protein